MDKYITSLDEEIFRKFSKNLVTYYSPNKVFIYLGFRQSTFWMNIFTNVQKIQGVTNIKNHENWGRIVVNSENQLNKIMEAVKKSYGIMKEAVKNNINTGWFALSKKEENEEDIEDIQENGGLITYVTRDKSSEI